MLNNVYSRVQPLHLNVQHCQKLLRLWVYHIQKLLHLLLVVEFLPHHELLRLGVDPLTSQGIVVHQKQLEPFLPTLDFATI